MQIFNGPYSKFGLGLSIITIKHVPDLDCAMKINWTSLRCDGNASIIIALNTGLHKIQNRIWIIAHSNTKTRV